MIILIFFFKGESCRKFQHFDILGRSVWYPVALLLESKFPSLFSVGIADVFEKVSIELT